MTATTHRIVVGTQQAPCCPEHRMPKVECSCGWTPDRHYPGMDAHGAVLGHRLRVIEEACGLTIEVTARA